MKFILCHMLALTLGCVLDLVIGDPPRLPHPVRWIGRLIAAFERWRFPEDAERDPRREFRAGIALCVVTLTATGAVVAAVTIGAYALSTTLGVFVEAWLTCRLLAARCLRDESMKVADALEHASLDDARRAVSMIVGRDVARLDAAGVTRAAVETVAENASDGVVAPLLYTILGGPVAGFLYKAVNTLDSMVGYHNDRYEYFGKAAARLDDVANFVPSRICAVLMILASFLAGKGFSGTDAWRIFRRDRYNHKSPNSAQTESAVAGALGVRLAGDAWYFGKLVKKPYIGDARREIEPRDVARACSLMFAAGFLTLTLGLAALAALVLATGRLSLFGG